MECFSYIAVTKFNIQAINITICYICVIYTMLGGIKSVVWTGKLDVSTANSLKMFE